MPTKDSLYPDDPLPLFLADEFEHEGIGKAWDRTVLSSRVLKAGILLALGTAIGVAILSVGNPVRLFADVTASFDDVATSPVDKSALQPDSDQLTPTIQFTADAQPLPPAAKDAPTGVEIAAASEPAGQSQAESSVPASEALFREFQAWLAEKDAEAKAGPIQHVEDASEQVAGNARASIQPVQKRRHVRSVQNEQAERRPVNNPRKRVRHDKNARVQAQPAQTAKAQDQSVQNPQTPSFLQIFGWRN
jgi:hypothetical protein